MTAAARGSSQVSQVELVRDEIVRLVNKLRSAEDKFLRANKVLSAHAEAMVAVTANMCHVVP